MNKLIGVYGASGCGVGIMPLIREQYLDAKIVFIDDKKSNGLLNGHQIIDWAEFLEESSKQKFVSIAIANPRIRKALSEKCMKHSIPLIEACASSVVKMDNVELGDGACLSPFVTLTSNISIGLCFHANLYSFIEHDSVIGDYVTLAPGAKVNGNVLIEDCAFIGAGAIIRQGVSIGKRAIVGMGAVVVQDVPADSTVVGNPAKILGKR